MKRTASYIFLFFNFGSDIGISIILLYIISSLLNFDITGELLAFSVAFSLLPDIDNFVEVPLLALNKISPNKIHRAYTHFPLPYIFASIPFMFANRILGIMFLVNVIFHFIHDSIGTGWGIAWLYPLKKKYYKLFANKEGILSKKVVQSWTPKERSKFIKSFNDRNWMQNLYINSWKLKSFKIATNGPSEEWLRGSYKRTRWFFITEIMITVTGFIILKKIIF